MGRARAVAIGLAALALAGCGPGVALDGLVDGGRAVAVSAASGDRLVLADGRRLRLAGIEAPRAGEPWAEEARAALGRLAAGRELELLLDAPGRSEAAQLRDRRSRRWLQAALLEAGAARVRTSAVDRAMAAEMLDAEARARLRRRGLWALPAYRVALASEIGPAARGFRIVEGRVRRVERSGRRLHLDLGDDPPSSLSVELPASAAAEFALAGRPLPGLAGKLVRVRGPVEALRLRIDHPEAIEELDPKRLK